ncbi:MAG: hypothetical protein JRI90_10405 [Deltaproteobacteria bacterium]|nr:hypothetical protein [Deltaproteobacteria bacterium]
MKRVRYVVGKVEGPLELEKDERVIFAGDCTSWQGTLNGRVVRIRPSYKGKAEVDTRKTKSNDLLLKTFQSLWKCFRNRNAPYVHARGCPVSVADHVNYLASVAGIKNPNFDSRLLIPVNVAYWKMRLMRFLNRIFS